MPDLIRHPVYSWIPAFAGMIIFRYLISGVILSHIVCHEDTRIMPKRLSEGVCEMCGHYVKIRQRAHIVAEGKKSGDNLLMLCPSCHIMFDTHVNPKVYKSLKQAGCDNLPDSWEKSIYQQATEASQAARKKTHKKG